MMAPNKFPRRIDVQGAHAFPAGGINWRRDAVSAATATTSAHTTYIAIGASVGAVLFIGIVGVIAWILRTRKQHQKAILELEQGASVSAQEIVEAPRLVSGVICASLRPLSAQAGWDALGSNDNVNNPSQVASIGKRKRSSVSLPKRTRRAKGIPLRPWKHLSAIVESPRNLSGHSSSPTEQVPKTMDGLTTYPLEQNSIGDAAVTDAISTDTPDVAFERTGSPPPEVVPSLAIRSPAKCGAAIAINEDKSRTVRSVSTGALETDGAVFGQHAGHITWSGGRQRPQLRARSLSLGAPLSRPPSGPVPPLPVIPPLNISNRDSFRQGICVALSNSSSMSSLVSAGSSVLATSPILTMHDDEKSHAAPNVEDIVGEDDNAELKSVSNRQWRNPRESGIGPRSSDRSGKVEKPRSSVRGSMMRYSSDSLLCRRMSSASASSTESGLNRLSIPRIATADRISVSRVSSTNSLTGMGSIQKIDTPTRRKSQRRSQVSASGSPAERNRKVGALLNMSSKPPSTCRMSISTRDSRSSSNGNPFHWDCNPIAAPKPSALKGSPNARKGHRRQNCVRISTLTPEILGFCSRSRSVSPVGLVMDEIREERESDEIRLEKGEREAVAGAVASEGERSTLRFPRLITSSEPCPRVQTLRASLTPSSPTLSTWNAYTEERRLTTWPPDSNISISTNHRADSRQSNFSSFSIPKFPSPSKARASVALCHQIDTATNPGFPFDMESSTLGFNEKKSSSPSALNVTSDKPSPVSPVGDSPVDLSPVSPVDVDSSPPLPISKTKEYDPAWPLVKLPAPAEVYDPASPPVAWDKDAERSSWFLPFAVNAGKWDGISPKSRPTSHAARGAESPFSPRTVQRFQPCAEKTEKLTSENASSILAQMPEAGSSSSTFLGTSMPVLLPPTTGDEYLYQAQYHPQPETPPEAQHHKQRSTSPFRTPRSGPPAPSLPTIPQSDDSPPQFPSPLTLSSTGTHSRPAKHTPQGPRSAPAPSVLKNVSALRRMNSEVQCHDNHASRTYVRLGREASPLLPWIGATFPEREESRHNDLWGGVDCASTQPGADAGALDEIEFAAIARAIDGAIAGFNADVHSNGAKRRSGVWEDEEGFWDDEGARCRGRADVVQLPRWESAEGRATPKRWQAVDPGLLLSTPMDRLKHGAGGGSVLGTPRSLYDAEGFLKT